MKLLDNLSLGVAAGLAAGLTTLAYLGEDAIGLAHAAKVGINAVVFGLLTVLFRSVIQATVFKWKRLRRTILRDDYVEGTWVDVVFYEDRPPLIGIVQLRPAGTSLHYFGENFQHDGSPAGTFDTEVVDVSPRRLVFAYVGQSGATGHLYGGGLGKIQFVGDGRPTRFAGSCADLAEGCRHSLVGLRVEDADSQKRLEDPNTRILEAFRLARPLLEHPPSGCQGMPAPTAQAGAATP